MSNSESAPFGLDNGLTLEGPESTLRWDATAQELSLAAPPTKGYPVPEAGSFLLWKGKTVFNGLNVDVLYRSDAPNAFWLYLRDKARFKLVSDSYKFVLAELVAKLGKPHSSFTDHRARPRAQWQYGAIHVNLGIGEHYFPGPLHLSFSVSKNGGVVKMAIAAFFRMKTRPVAKSVDGQFNKAQEIYQEFLKSHGTFAWEHWQEAFPAATQDELREWDGLCTEIQKYSWDMAELVRDDQIGEDSAERLIAARYPRLSPERISAVYDQAMFVTR
jgi:hypothetical protein